jgi:hypothetical protein
MNTKPVNARNPVLHQVISAEQHSDDSLCGHQVHLHWLLIYAVSLYLPSQFIYKLTYHFLGYFTVNRKDHEKCGGTFEVPTPAHSFGHGGHIGQCSGRALYG